MVKKGCSQNASRGVASCELPVASWELRVPSFVLPVMENGRAQLQPVYSVNFKKLKGTSCD